jgi:hypothetical protein
MWTDVPEKMRLLIEKQRAENSNANAATDAEALMYLSSSSQVAPLDHDFYKIMAHLSANASLNTRKIFDGENTELDGYLLHRLQHLKEWLRRSQTRRRKL